MAVKTFKLDARHSVAPRSHVHALLSREYAGITWKEVKFTGDITGEPTPFTLCASSTNGKELEVVFYKGKEGMIAHDAAEVASLFNLPNFDTVTIYTKLREGKREFST